MEEVKNYQIDRKYRVTFEQATSTKGVIGFKVEVNGDDVSIVRSEALTLLDWAKEKAPAISTETK